MNLFKTGVVFVSIFSTYCNAEDPVVTWLHIAKITEISMSKERLLYDTSLGSDPNADIAEKLILDASAETFFKGNKQWQQEAAIQLRDALKAHRTARLISTAVELEHLLLNLQVDYSELAMAYLEIEGVAALQRNVFVSLKVINSATRDNIESVIDRYSKLNESLLMAGVAKVDKNVVMDSARSIVLARSFEIVSILSEDQMVRLAKLAAAGEQKGQGEQKVQSSREAGDGPE
jgi:hypothetical protein